MFGVSKKPHVLNPTPSDIWFQKQRAYFNSLDSDNNGYLTCRDKDVLIRDFDSHPHGSKFKGRFHKNLDDIWSFLEVAPKITYEKYLEGRCLNLKKHRESKGKYDDPEHMPPIKTERYGYYKLIFDLTDINEDKFWDFEEGKMHFHVFCRDKVSEEEALAQMKLMDKADRGKVSLGEFMQACYKFDFDEEPGTFDNIYGQLPPLADSKPAGF